MTTSDIRVTTLTSPWVTLEPIDTRDPIAHIDTHAHALARAISSETFRYFSIAPRSSDKAGVGAFIERVAALPGTVPFVVLTPERRAVGMTSYCDIRPASRGVEIGWTWIARHAQGTAINPAMKHLLLHHAFETPLFTASATSAIRVQLKTNADNEHSRRAIAKLGARFEGVLRNHRLTLDGTPAGSAMYSITCEEWPKIDLALRARLNARPEHASPETTETN